MSVGDAAFLVLNAGSSSIKFAVFDGGLERILAGSAEGIGAQGRVSVGDAGAEADLPDHRAALRAALDGLAAAGVSPQGLRAAAHRVVHGGESLTEPAAVTPQVRAAIEDCVPLAPLHNPHNLSGIDALSDIAPGLPQYASFDTAFHADNSAAAARYAIPARFAEAGLRRYGFHGISYAALTRTLPEISAEPLPARLLALHLGNGCSLCAIRDGKSAATTMGYSPVSGLSMGTRAGDIDANAVLRLAEEIGIDAARGVLNGESGLKGLSGGISDMRALERDGSAESRFAIEHFCHWAVRHAGSAIAAMGGLDAIAFTGGIGENAAPVRARIMEGLAWLGLEADADANAAGAARLHREGSRIAAWIVPAREERQIAADALRLMEAGG